MQDGNEETASASDASGGPGGFGAAAPPPPPPPPPPLPRSGRLYRRADHRVIAGVAGGLGDYFGIDPLIFRIAFVALSFVGAIGLLMYIAGWLMIPESTGREPIGVAAARRLESRHIPVIVGVVLLAIAVVVILNSLHLTDDGLVWGLALVAVGVFLLTRETWPEAWTAQGWRLRWNASPASPQSFTSTPAPAQSFASAPAAPSPQSFASAPAPAAPLAGWRSQPAAGFGGPAAGSRTPSPAAPRARSVLGGITVAVALLAVGVAALLDNLGVLSLSVGNGLALVLLILGLGLIVGGWFGRSRALIVLALALLPFAAAASLVNEPLSGGAGDRHVTPQALADLRGNYQLAAGQLTLDLSQIDFRASRTVSASVALGRLYIVVPAGVAVDVHGSIGAGELDLLGHVDDGVQIQSQISAPGSTATGDLHLDLSVGFGNVTVVRPATIPGG